MVEHMRERNAMQDGPGDPKKIKAKADSLMSQSRYKKNNAALLEEKAKNTKDRFPSYAFKEGENGSIREYMTPGRLMFEQKSRVMKASAERDSMKAEGLYKFSKQNESTAKRLKEYRKKK